MLKQDSVTQGKERSDSTQIGVHTFSQWMDVAFATLLAGVTLYLFLAAPMLIDKVILEPEEIPPAFFPRVVLLVIFALSMGVIARVVLGHSLFEVDLTWKGVLRMGVMFTSMLVYILVFKRLGFLVSTALLILFQSWYYGERNWIKLALLTVIFPPLIYILFIRVFHILLPRGIL